MRIPNLGKRTWKFVIAGAAVLVFAMVAFATRNQWLPKLQDMIASAQSGGEDDESDAKDAAHDDATSLELSETARRNVGLQTSQVTLQPFVRTVSVPAIVVERPGRSQVEITAPFTGTVTKIHPIEGEAVTPGQPLFELRLTHEDLVTAQREFLRSAEELNVIKREVARLERVGDKIVAGVDILKEKYEQQKIEAALHAQRQGLVLHGITDDQIDEILQSRKLLQSLTVVAPPYAESGHRHEVEHLYHVQKIHVKRGQQVSAGEKLCVLGDHCELYVEGQAFEEDAEALNRAANAQWKVKAVPVSDDKRGGDPEVLDVLYLSDQVDSQSRALRFYMSLENEIVRDVKKDGNWFIGWKFRPGQRMQVLVPVERWDNQIVLPVEAVVEEGAEAYVFEQNGDHFDRVPVHVEYRDKNWIVIENDGALVGSTVAVAGAYQMQLALKNKSGGGVDPHAGHNH